MIGIQKIVATYGVANVRVFLPLRESHSLHGFGLPLAVSSNDSNEEIVECAINEERYKVADGYKITFTPVADREDGRLFLSETFYQSDFDSLRRGLPEDFRIYILVDEDAKYERFRDEVLA